MNKSSDLDIIKQLEKELGVTLKKVEMGEIEEKKRWDRVLQDYALDEEGRVKVLSLDSLRLSKPQIRLVSQLHFLEQASFKSTRLKDYSFLSSLTQLTSLNLRANNLTDVSFLSSLTQLTSLNLGFNNLSDVSFLSSLTHLTSLNLARNSLTDVSFLSSLTQLTSLDLEYNPITNPPPEIVTKGIEAIHSFFKQVDEQGKARLYEARLLLVW